MFRIAVSLLLRLMLDVVSLSAALLIFFEGKINADVYGLWWCSFPVVLLVKTTVFATFGEWHGHEHRSISKEFGLIVFQVLLSAAILVATVVAGLLDNGPPVPVIAVDGAISLLVTLVLRAAIRAEAVPTHPRHRSGRTKKSLLLRADRAALEILDALKALQPECDVVAILNMASASESAVNASVPTVPLRKGLRDIARRYDANQLLIPDDLPGPAVRRLLQDCRANGLDLGVLADAGQVALGRMAPQIRPVTVSDLFQPEHTGVVNSEVAQMIAEKTVLVTGAAGRVGAECCRQILALQPEILILVDRSETDMRRIREELDSRRLTDTHLIFSVSDVNDQISLARIFTEFLPDVVIHAAGYHDSVLMAQNVQSAIRNNVLGARSVIDLADRFGIERFVMISSHKALHPTEIVGATARLGERYLEAIATTSQTQYVSVRIGNALGSAECASRTFQTQITDGRPIQVASAEMLVAISILPELVNGILRAGALGKTGQILVLDCEQVVKATELARDVILVSGEYAPREIKIAATDGQQVTNSTSPPLRDVIRPLQQIDKNLYAVEQDAPPVRNIKLELQQLERASHGDFREACNAIQSLIAEFAGGESTAPASDIVPLSKVFARTAA